MVYSMIFIICTFFDNFIFSAYVGFPNWCKVKLKLVITSEFAKQRPLLGQYSLQIQTNNKRKANNILLNPMLDQHTIFFYLCLWKAQSPRKQIKWPTFKKICLNTYLTSIFKHLKKKKHQTLTPTRISSILICICVLGSDILS